MEPGERATVRLKACVREGRKGRRMRDHRKRKAERERERETKSGGPGGRRETGNRNGPEQDADNQKEET